MKIAALVAFIAVVLTVLIIRVQVVDYQGFMENAYKGTAQITTQKEVVTDPKNQRKEAQVEYRYMAGGRVYTHTEKLEYADIWEKSTPGKTVDIYISKKDAGDSYLAEAMDRRLKIAGKAGK